MNNDTPLTAKQITVLAIYSVKAWKVWCANVGDDISSGDWRKSVQVMLLGSGKESLKNCTQEDYLTMINYYRAILGEPLLVERNRDIPNGRRQIMWHIEQAMEIYGLSWAYVHAICLSRWQREIDGYTVAECREAILAKLGEPELRQLLVTIKSRGKSKQRNQA